MAANALQQQFQVKLQPLPSRTELDAPFAQFLKLTKHRQRFHNAATESKLELHAVSIPSSLDSPFANIL